MARIEIFTPFDHQDEPEPEQDQHQPERRMQYPAPEPWSRPQQRRPFPRDAHVVNDQDLAMYAAITGRRPTIEVVEQQQHRPAVSMGYLLPDAADGLKNVLNTRGQKKIAVWVRHFSHEARRRIDQARLRLAS